MGSSVFGNARARRLALVIALAALAALAIALIAGRQSPTLPHTGLLAFIRDGDVYLAKPDGSDARLVLRQDGIVFSTVAWSPHHERLAIDASSGVVVLDTDTGQTTFVGGTNPVWSPDGGQLAVLDPSALATGQSLRILDAATLSTSKVYSFPAFSGLAWSPNGRWIAATGGKAVMRIDVATGEVIQIDAPSGHLDSPRKVRWSPDSRLVAFIRYNGLRAGNCGLPSCQVDVYVANADGSDPVRVNQTPGRADMPTWSPDGEWVAFRDIGGGSALVGEGIRVVRPDGTEERSVLEARVRALVWSPEGDRLLFTVDDGSPAATLWETTLDGQAHSLGLSIDDGSTPFGRTDFGFAWQATIGETAALPSFAAPAPTLSLVTPAPAAPADLASSWPTIASDAAYGCDPVTFATATGAQTLIAHLCEDANLLGAGWSPTGGAYALVRGPEGGPFELVIVRLDGSIAFELTVTLGSGFVWSPDGSRLGFNVGGVPWIVQQDAGGVWFVAKTEVSDAIDLVWSPDGRRLAVADSEGRLLVGEPDGSEMHSIGSIPQPFTWAPDGARLAFVRDGNVWVVDADGTNPHNVSALPFGGAVDASWSPDGRWIAIDTPSAILLVAPDGTTRRWLDFGAVSLFGAAWSPDSSRLAIGLYGSSNQVLIAAIDGSPVVQIDEAGRPQWTPDGRFLVVASDDLAAFTDMGNLAVMNPDGSGRHELPITPSGTGPVVWVR
jgi:Tol biopolymer transport system component